MKSFTFKTEAKWMLLASLAPLAMGFLICLIVWFVRHW